MALDLDDVVLPTIIGSPSHAALNEGSRGSDQLELPLDTHPYFSGDGTVPRDNDGWAPVPCALSARGPAWKVLLAKCGEVKERIKPGRANHYYEELFSHIEELHEADMCNKENGAFTDDQRVGVVGTRFIYVSLACNVLIFAVKAFSAVSSGSLAILASALDSLLDLISGSALSFVASLMRRQNKYVYPVGKARMEPLGIIVFAALMGSCSVQVLVAAVEDLVDSKAKELPIDVWVLMVGVTFSKGLLFIYGRRATAHYEALGHATDTMEAQTDDHRNDVLTNILSLLGAYFASQGFSNSAHIAQGTLNFIDPLAAILLSLYIMRNWFNTGLEQMGNLVGKAGPPGLIRKITYMALTHCTEIIAVDTVRAFTFGPRFIVEVDIVLPPEMSTQQSHDIGESLQIRIESLMEVERCYIHLDWEVEHQPEHKSTVRATRTRREEALQDQLVSQGQPQEPNDCEAGG